MKFTSVRGHLMNWEFPNGNKKWIYEAIPDLFNSINIHFYLNY